MPSLAEVQRLFRGAVVAGTFAPVAPHLVGGQDPVRRLEIHRNHFETSLVSALVGRFQATAWLVGESQVREAALTFVHRHPPTAPCIAEYGDQFPAFLAMRPTLSSLSYVLDFANLDWQLGRLAISVDAPALTRSDLAAQPTDALVDAVGTLQTGSYRVHAGWPVDELMQAYLADAVPARWTYVNQTVWVEVRGSRGVFRFTRLTEACFRFRQAVDNGQSFGDAAALAFALDPLFDSGTALSSLVDDGLITQIHFPPTGASL